MTLTLDREQARILGEILHTTLNQLRVESARTDGHGFREMLHDRERAVESMLGKLSEQSAVLTS